MFSPGSSTAWKRPTRSTTQARCCGTTRIALMTTIRATMKKTSVSSEKPLIMNKSLGMEGVVLRSGGTLGCQEERRAARADDVHGALAPAARMRELGAPLRAPVGDARGAVLVPYLDLDALAHVQPWLRRRSAFALAPLVGGVAADERKCAADEQLGRHGRTEPGRRTAEEARNTHREEIERSGDELRADERHADDPPQPVRRHAPPPVGAKHKAL